MTRRWVCPTCGSGVLAPSRPRKDDVRRFCLACSEKSGRLVQRVCPAAETSRTRKADARKAASARRRERERTAEDERHTVDGMDVREELQRLCKLPFVRRHFPGGRSPVRLTVSWSKSREYTTGHSKIGLWHVHLGLWEGCPRHEAEALLAHELAHAILPPGISHRERWRRTFARVVADGYGIAWIPDRAMEGDIYEFDALVERALRERNGDERQTYRERWARARRAV